MKENEISGYFTVEAALIMPVVLGCYLLVGTVLCFMYERCILEQNACRLLVWEEYAEGYSEMYPEDGERMSEDRMWEYLLDCMNEEEQSRYILGRQVQTEVTVKRKENRIERSFVYSPFANRTYGLALTAGCPEPAGYIRAMNLLGNIFIENKGNADED